MQNPSEGAFWGPEMTVQEHVDPPKRVGRLGKTSSSGGIDGPGWPLTWGRAEAAGGSVASLKPL